MRKLVLIIVLQVAFLGFTQMGCKSDKPSGKSIEETVSEADTDEYTLPEGIADFTASKQEVAVGEEIRFTDKSKDAVKYWWDFGDGNLSKEKNPTHRYTSSGIKTVTLKINGEFGASKTLELTVVEKQKATTAPEVPPVQLEQVVLEALQTIAGSDDGRKNRDIYYQKLKPLVENEKIKVSIIKGGETREETFYSYYMSLNFSVENNITGVKVTSSDGKISGLTVNEK